MAREGILYKITEKVIEREEAGEKIIKFNVGDPDQFTHREIIEAAFQAMKEEKTKYGSAFGEKKLREKIAEIYRTKPEKVIITPGSKWALFSILNIILKKGEEIILPSPHWSSYELILKKIGVKIKFLKSELEKDWQIDIDKFKALIGEKTKLVILNNPNNPTSQIIKEEIIKKIIDLANRKGIIILSDETYADISFKKVKSILDFEGPHILINSFSKTFAMTGWRLGFAICPEEIVEKITELNQITITCVPPFIQKGGVKALELREKIINRMRKIYQKRANLAYRILAKTKLKFSFPDAPFYLFIKCFCDSEKLAFDLLKQGIAITPGTAFGDFKEYFRVSLTLPEEEIKEGLKKIAKCFT